MVSPGLHGDAAVGLDELGDGNQTFGLVAEIDDHFGGGDLEHMALQHFTLRGRREVAVVVDELFVIRHLGRHQRLLPPLHPGHWP